jgi:hypothetical protein
MLLRKFCLCLFAAALATSALTTGCRSQSAETVHYSQWEAETHRDHKDINQRPPDEQKEYQDWRQKHQDNH